MTAFHVALQAGHTKVVSHFFDAYPPSDDDYKSMYRSPENTSNLRLALGTKEPEMVWTVLEKHLYTKEEIEQAWNLVTGRAFKSSISSLSKYEEFVNLFTTFGDFSLGKDQSADPSPAPERENGTSRQPRPAVKVENVRSHTASPVSATSESVSTPSSPSVNLPRGRGKSFRRGSFRPFPQGSPSSPDSEPTLENKPQTNGAAFPPSNFRGNGRGRGRGRGFRGRGRGRGRGGFHSGASPQAA